jgi:hypothetical protein
MAVPFEVWRFLVVYILNPTLLIPLGAYIWSRYRGTYAEPKNLPGAVPREFLEVFFGLLGTVMAFAGIRNVGLLHFTRPLTFVATTCVLLRMPAVPRRRRRLYLGAMGLGLAAAGVGYFLDTPAYRNAVFTTVQSLIFLTISAVELKSILSLEDDLPVADRPEFWFLSALLVFASGSLLFNATSNYFLRTLSRDLLPVPWVAVNVVYLVYYLLMARVFLCPRPTSS